MTLTNKNIIVKLIRSTLAISNIDNMPKNVIVFSLAFIFSLIMFPFSLISHIINLTSKEYYTGSGIGAIILFILWIGGFVTTGVLELFTGIHYISLIPDWCIFTIYPLALVGAIALAIFCVCIFYTVKFFIFINKKFGKINFK